MYEIYNFVQAFTGDASDFPAVTGNTVADNGPSIGGFTLPSWSELAGQLSLPSLGEMG